ncbi:hypothetical protein PISMIDRAFT_681642 [Pisolithus microcarpus 441]|uniref:Uncharacterized protein n=1 Tax=Pisolithus microcarpus 441 TaxID=765257 RepID=A0A0C9Z4L0_9AGAM|nr:hypothetical protein PISMIDRAFT_681642 [Pisolithus microcarpus 441]
MSRSPANGRYPASGSVDPPQKPQSMMTPHRAVQSLTDAYTLINSKKTTTRISNPGIVAVAIVLYV